jgi:hypothetical protein
MARADARRENQDASTHEVMLGHLVMAIGLADRPENRPDWYGCAH